jgi:hypothetical protein
MGTFFHGRRWSWRPRPGWLCLYREEVVRLALFHQVDGVGALGVERVGGYHRRGQIGILDLVQQRGELRDLIRLGGDLACGHRHAVAVAHRRQDDHLAAVAAARSA